MQNVKITTEKGELVIRCKLDPKLARPSSTGKTKLLASTEGATPFAVPATKPGDALYGLKVALNVMIPNG